MRFAFVGVCLLLLVAGCAAPEQTANDEEWAKEPWAVPFMKIGRGTVNVVVSPADIPATVTRRWDEAETMGGYGGAVVVGTGEGLCNGVARLGMGVVEMLSCPLYYQTEPYYEKPIGYSVFGLSEEDEELEPIP